MHGVTPVTTLPGRVIGAKPAEVCRWIFGLLGAASGDILDDLFPGSGAVTRAWAAYTSRDPSCAPECRTSREVGDTLSPAASDASCKARADASAPAAADGSDPSGEALDDGCLFPLEAAR